MRRLPVAVLTGLLIAALLPAAPAAANAQRDAIDQLNKIRRSHGLAALRPSRSLHHSSTRYAHHIVSTGYFGHQSRIAVSSGFRRAGETLEMHSGWQPEPSVAIQGWMNSAATRLRTAASARSSACNARCASGSPSSSDIPPENATSHFGRELVLPRGP